MGMKPSDKKIVITWLMTGFFLVFLMVVIGGITRLTHSGLSMVEWKPVVGVVPPLNEVQWLIEFEKYKTSPEFIRTNNHFTLSEYKSIYWWEYIHRLLGRILGIVFIIPFIIFLIKKIIPKKIIPKIAIVFVLGGLQGFLGWYMVSSGLVKIPAVSHYRLAAHLSLALLLMMYILWLVLSIYYVDSSKRNKSNKYLKYIVLTSFAIVVTQIVYGAYTAGLKAGFMYNTYPKMGDSWLPNIISQKIDEIGLLSLLEYPVTVQFIHRWLGTFLFMFISGLFFFRNKFSLSQNQLLGLKAVVLSVFGQFLLGVFTLVLFVPTSIAVLHQAGAVVVLSCFIFFVYHLYYNDSY